MNTPSYIASNLEELFDQAPPDIQNLIQGEDVNTTTAVLGRLYKLPVSSYVTLENIISFLLIGALKPEDAVRCIKDMLGFSEDDAVKLAQDLEKTILEKARVKILGKPATEMVTLTFQEGRSADDLRKEIMDTTKRESALVKEQSSAPKADALVQPTAAPAPTSVPEPAIAQGQPAAPQPQPAAAQPATGPAAAVETEAIATTSVQGQGVAAGSRTQLLEQLQVLDNIPNDDEIAERLTKIREQIAGMTGNRQEAPAPAAPLHNYILGDKADEAIEAGIKPATYSKAPTKYNVDPYREPVEE